MARQRPFRDRLSHSVARDQRRRIGAIVLLGRARRDQRSRSPRWSGLDAMQQGAHTDQMEFSIVRRSDPSLCTSS